MALHSRSCPAAMECASFLPQRKMKMEAVSGGRRGGCCATRAALTLMRHCEERSERISQIPTNHSMSLPGLTGQSSIPEEAVLESMGRGVLDRPVEPGDDSGEDVIQRSRDTICPSFASLLCAPPNRGRREDRMLAAPVANAQKENHRCNRSDPAFPARVVYGLYVLSPVSGLFSHRPPGLSPEVDP